MGKQRRTTDAAGNYTDGLRVSLSKETWKKWGCPNFGFFEGWVDENNQLHFKATRTWDSEHENARAVSTSEHRSLATMALRVEDCPKFTSTEINVVINDDELSFQFDLNTLISSEDEPESDPQLSLEVTEPKPEPKPASDVALLDRFDRLERMLIENNRMLIDLCGVWGIGGAQ